MMYRIEPAVLTKEDRWKGFGSLDAAALQKCFELRKELDAADIKRGSELWEAFRRNDLSTLKQLSTTASDRFPYLSEVCEAAIEMDLWPSETLIDIKKEGATEFDDIFAEFSRREVVYGFGDLKSNAFWIDYLKKNVGEREEQQESLQNNPRKPSESRSLNSVARCAGS
jgi:hypothetical protein